MSTPGLRILWSILCLVCVLFTGCATGPKIDWNTRIGNYTYDQAVLEYGPPDRIAALTDGTKVAEWMTGRGFSQGFAQSYGPYYAYPHFYAPPTVYYSEPSTPDRFLRLTFTPDGKLANWQRVYR